MSTLNVNTISNSDGSGAPNFPNGISVNSNPIPTAGSLSNRNKIINGNFDIWQRGTSGTSGYVADRWFSFGTGSTVAISRQSFTLGQTDVPNEPTYFIRHVVTSSAGTSNRMLMEQRVEDVRTFAGQTVTLSFWAKADASKNIAVEFVQDFGTGGSPSTAVTAVGVTTCALTTSWQKFTITASIPSISGKTLGTDGNSNLRCTFWFDAGSDFNARTNSLGQQSGTFDIAQVQLEAGDVATPFETRLTGYELDLCCRYYEKSYNLATAPGSNVGTTASVTHSGGGVNTFQFTSSKRASPTLTIYSTAGTSGQYSFFSGGTWSNSGATQFVFANQKNGNFNSASNTLVTYEWAADSEL
jgi:hypothetical protein